MTIELIMQAEVLLDLFDSHNAVKKPYQGAYAVRRKQLLEAIKQAEDEIASAHACVAELESIIEDCPYCLGMYTKEEEPTEPCSLRYKRIEE